MLPVAETVGWLADKLSIVELKIYHMREQAERGDATPAFRAQCEEKLAVLRMQRDDLAAELTTLLADIASGRSRSPAPTKEIHSPRARAIALFQAS